MAYMKGVAKAYLSAASTACEMAAWWVGSSVATTVARTETTMENQTGREMGESMVHRMACWMVPVMVW